jgi:hypothetical protein
LACHRQVLDTMRSTDDEVKQMPSSMFASKGTAGSTGHLVIVVADWSALVKLSRTTATASPHTTRLAAATPPPQPTLPSTPPPPQCLRLAPSPPLRARAPRPLPPLSSPAPPSDPRPPPPHSPPPQEPVPVALARHLQTSALRGLCASTRRRTACLTMPETTSS